MNLKSGEGVLELIPETQDWIEGFRTGLKPELQTDSTQSKHGTKT